MKSRLPALLIVALAWTGSAAAQPAPLDAALAQLVAGDLGTRTNAARQIRRADPAQAVPALERAVREHPDEYIRFRALVLLTGFRETGISALMTSVLTDRNDRLRTVAYQWFEHHPEPAALPRLIAALDREHTEFVRPALTRAIAAQGRDPRARNALLPLVLRGEDLFRGAVIEAAGDYQIAEAILPITEVAERDGPLQDDAVTALGELGNPEARTTLVTLQASVHDDLQPTVAAALCLIGIDCAERAGYVMATLGAAAANPEYQPLLRGAVHAAAVLALHGRADVLDRLLDVGVSSADPARAAIALGVGRVALRQPLLLLDGFEARADRAGGLSLLLDAFDMLSEDFEEEQFFVALRAAYWDAPDGSPRRETARAIIDTLEF